MITCMSGIRGHGRAELNIINIIHSLRHFGLGLKRSRGRRGGGGGGDVTVIRSLT